MATESVITQQMQDAVGVDSAAATYVVEAGAVRRFAEAIGDPNPLYREERAARRSRYGGLIAPPTFLRSMEAGEETVPFRNPYPEVLDGGSDWQYFEPVRVGDTITVVSRIAGLTERTGRLGPMLMVSRETEYTNQLGDTVAKQLSTYIYYSPSTGSD